MNGERCRALWARPASLGTLVPLAGLALLLVAFLAGPARQASAQSTVEVAVGDFFFCDPSEAPGACLTGINAGDTVRWEYRTGTEGHTVTDCGSSCDSPAPGPLFDSGLLVAGQSFGFTFREPGTFLYYCRFHPEAMRAVVVVQATDTPTPAPTTPAATATPTSPTAAATPGADPAAAADERDGALSPWWLVLTALAGILLLVAGARFMRRRL